MHKRVELFAILLVFLSGCTTAPPERKAAVAEPQKAQLFVELPDFVATPDGMATAPDGDLVLAAPNFAQTSLPACFVKISKDRKIRKWFDVPVLAETHRCCPMGIEFGPQGELYVADNQNWAAGNGAKGEINQGRILRLRIKDDQLVESGPHLNGAGKPPERYPRHRVALENQAFSEHESHNRHNVCRRCEECEMGHVIESD